MRKAKSNFYTRRFVSKRQEHWGPYISGLRYGDVRSHQKRPHVRIGNGSKELNSVPDEPMHGCRKEWKKMEKEDRRKHKATLRKNTPLNNSGNTMNHNRAFETGKSLFIIRDNKIVGEGRVSHAIGDDWAAVEITKGDIYEALLKTEACKRLGTKYVWLRYFSLTGMFICSSFTDQPELDEMFQETRAVDQFNLGWGMVPDSFKDVEGYSFKHTEIDTQP